MDIHVRRLGTLNILFGVISLLVSTVLLVVYGGPIGIYESTDDNVLGLLVSVSAMAHLLLGIPCIIGGISLRKLQEWSRGMLIVTSALNIVNVPIGSILGAYGLWVLLTPETDPLFTHEPTNRITNKGVSQTRSGAGEPSPAPKQNSTTIVPSPRS
jgi:hypothetical protein